MQLPTIEGHYKGFTAYYIKDSSGSVINPDRHLSESNGRLQRWIQWGDTDSGNGSMIFLDTNLQKIATLKMYRTNRLWYARVGNGTTRIDTGEQPSIQAAALDTHNDNHDYTPSPPTKNMDNDVINMVINDIPPQQTYSSSPDNIRDIPQIHSAKVWDELSRDNAPPLLQRTDTCSEFDSESTCSNSEDPYRSPIPIVVTTKPSLKQKPELISNLSSSNPPTAIGVTISMASDTNPVVQWNNKSFNA